MTTGSRRARSQHTDERTRPMTRSSVPPRLTRAVAALATALCLLAALAAAQASAADFNYAATIFDPQTQFGTGPGTGDGEFNGIRRVAVETSTGNVLIVDSGNDRVQVFAPTADAASYLTQFAAGDEPDGIAIDQSTGDVYVSASGTGQILKFNSDGQPTPAYSADGSFTSPASGPNPGEIGDFAADLAVDPASGDLLVADPSDDLIQRYHSDGSFVESYDGAGSPGGAFTALGDIDVDSTGDIFVLDADRVMRFGSDGTHELDFSSTATEPELIAVDPHTGQVAVAAPDVVWVDQIYIFRADGSLLGAHPSLVYSTVPAGIAFDAGTSKRLYWASGSFEQDGFVVNPDVIGVGLPAQLAEATVEAPTNVTADSVTFNATVDSNGSTGLWTFQYRKVGGSDWTDAGGGSFGPDGPTPVSSDATGLPPGEDYELRIMLQSAGVVEMGFFGSFQAITYPTDAYTFSYPAFPPFTGAIPAGGIGSTTATVAGLLGPRNRPTTYWFEYGTTTAYGTSIPAAQNADGGATNDKFVVRQQITGLTPGTRYHYRLVAENSAGTSHGVDLTFRTQTSGGFGLPSRGYEMVTPAEKDGQNPYASPRKSYLGQSGVFLDDVLPWEVYGSAPGGVVGAKEPFVARRDLKSPTGWTSKSMLPAMDQLSIDGSADDHWGLPSPQAAPLDYSTVIYRLFAGESDPQGIGRLSPAGVFSVLWRAQIQSDSGNEFQVSRDMSHVFVKAKRTEIKNPPAEMPAGPYQTFLLPSSPGQDPVPMSYLPGGQLSQCDTDDVISPYPWVAADGSRMFFETSPAADCSTPAQLYRRDLASGTTTRISPNPVAGGDGAAWYQRISDDGSSVLFISEARLTGDDDNTGRDAYLWRDGQPLECVTCAIDPDLWSAQSYGNSYGASPRMDVSPDLKRFYFRSRKTLVPGRGRAGELSLYLWDDGQVKFVAPLPAGEPIYAQPGPEDLSAFVFATHGDMLTADEVGDGDQVYRFDAASGELACISCPPPGAALKDLAPLTESSGHPYAALADGDGDIVAFATLTSLVPEDLNGTADIYEWHDGAVRLVTDGTTKVSPASSATPALYGISADGKSIFFSHPAHLTGFETDEAGKLFVARLGGGIYKPLKIANGDCDGDACQGDASVAPAPPQMATVTFSASAPAGRVPGAPKLANVSVTRKSAKGAAIRIVVKVPAKGTLLATGKQIATTAGAAPKAGSYKLTVRLTRAARRALARKRKLKVSFGLRYLPEGRTSSVARVRLTLKAARKGR